MQKKTAPISESGFQNKFFFPTSIQTLHVGFERD